MDPVYDVPDSEGDSNDKGSNNNHKGCYHQSLGVLISTGYNKRLYKVIAGIISALLLMSSTYRNGKTQGNQGKWPAEATGN